MPDGGVVKDIFVDASVAKNFSSALDPEYKKFIRWLFSQGWLVVSNKIIQEYGGCSRSAVSETNIMHIVARLQRDGRLIKKSNEELKRVRFKKHIEQQLTCNAKDRHHLRLIILSVRKYALIIDQRFRDDVNNFPGINAIAKSRPENIPYDK
jgi:hypothetical protein